MIAAYIGNIVGALFVALPAVYFYLGDYNYAAESQLVAMETAEGPDRTTPDSSSNNNSNEKAGDYRVSNRRAD